MSLIPIFNWVLAATLRGSIVVLLTLLLQRLLRSRLSARWNYAIWAPVLFAILIPAQPLLPYWEWPYFSKNRTTSHRNSASIVAVDKPPEFDSGFDRHSAPSERDNGAVQTAAPVANAARVSPPNPEVQTPAGEGAGKVQTPTIEGPEIAVVATGQAERSGVSSPSRNWRTILAAGWLLGTGCLIVVVWISYALTLRRIRHRAASVRRDDLASIQSLARELGLRRTPKAWLSSEVRAPAVCGVLRPTLLLNDGFFQMLSREEADFVLRHELMHIRRGDVSLNTMLFGVLSLHWFNPLLWYAFARAKADREAACDEDVLRAESPARRVAYGKTLLRMEAELPKSGLCLGFVGMVQRGKRLRERIRLISDPKRMGFSMKSLVLLCMSVTAILGIAKSAETPSDPQQPPSATDGQPTGESKNDENERELTSAPFRNAELNDSEQDAADLPARVQRYAAILGEAQDALDSKKPETARTRLLATEPELRGWEYEYLLRKSKEHQVRWTLPHPSGVVEGRVSCMTFTASGKRLILGRHGTEGASGSVSVWDFVNDKVVPLEHLGGSHFTAVARSGDGNTIAAAGRRGKVVVWDAATGKVVREYSGHNPDPSVPLSSREFLTVRSLAYGPDGKQIVSSASPNAGAKCANALQLWSVETGKTVLTVKGLHQAGKNRPILSVAYCPDGRTIASGGFDGTITLWDATNGKELRRVKGPFVNVLDLEFSPGGKRLACGSANSAIWDVASGKKLTGLIGYPQPVSSLAFSPDGKRLITGGWDRTVRIWDSQTGVQLLLLGTLKNRVGSVAMSADGESIAAGGPEGRAIPRPTVWSHRTVVAAQNSGDDDAAATLRKDADAYAWAQKKLQASRSSLPPAWRGNPSLPLVKPLVSLKLYNVSVADEELKHLGAFPKLKSLVLSGKRITDNGLNDLLILKELEVLRLQGTGITDDGMKQLAKLRNLKKLDLTGAKLTGAGILNLAALPNLQELVLEGTPIKDRALQHVSGMKELRELSLRNTKISDDGLRHLAMMPNLREITLQSTPVTGEGLHHLATSKSLRTINCWGTSVTSEDIRRLKEVMPNCDVNKTLIE